MNSNNKKAISKKNITDLKRFILDKHLLTIYKILTAKVVKITYIKNQTIALELPQRLNNVEEGFNELTANGGSPI